MRYLTQKELAKQSGLSVQVLRRLRLAGYLIPSMQFGSVVRFTPADLDRAVEASRKDAERKAATHTTNWTNANRPRTGERARP